MNASGKYGHAVVIHGFEVSDLFLAFRYHGKGRRLDTSAGKLSIVFAGQGSCGIDSHQPVSLRAGNCCCVQIIVVPAVS